MTLYSKKTQFNLISQQKIKPQLFGLQKDRTPKLVYTNWHETLNVERNAKLCEYAWTQHFSTSARNKFLVEESLLE